MPVPSTQVVPNGAHAKRTGDDQTQKQMDLDAVVADPTCQRLFRLFLFFAGDQLVRSPDGRLLRAITVAQAHFLLGQICLLRDQMQIRPDRVLPALHSEEDAQMGGEVGEAAAKSGAQLAIGDSVTFRTLLERALFVCPQRTQSFDPIVDRLFARYVLQIMRKGFLLCRRLPSHSPLCARLFSTGCAQSPADRLARWRGRRNSETRQHWRTYWCVLTPGQLQLWPIAFCRRGHRPVETAMWTIKLHGDAQIELVEAKRGEEENGNRALSKRSLRRWALATRSSLLELSHFDQLQRHLWISDLELAIRKRCASDLAQFDRANSAKVPPSLMWTHKLALAEREKAELGQMLEAERRALRDEECVRQLATRMLDEEAQKGEALRRTVHFLAGELEAERRERVELERRLLEQGHFVAPPKITVEAAAEEGCEHRDGTPFAPAVLRTITPIPRTKRAKKLRERRKEEQREEELQRPVFDYEQGTLPAAELWAEEQRGEQGGEGVQQQEQQQQQMAISTQSV